MQCCQESADAQTVTASAAKSQQGRIDRLSGLGRRTSLSIFLTLMRSSSAAAGRHGISLSFAAHDQLGADLLAGALRRVPRGPYTVTPSATAVSSGLRESHRPGRLSARGTGFRSAVS